MDENTLRHASLLKSIVQKHVPEGPEAQEIFSYLMGDTPNSVLGEAFLDEMQAKTVANDPSMGISEYRNTYPEMKVDPIANALGDTFLRPYTLSKGGLANLEAAREYNLARGLINQGRHTAPGISTADYALSLIGSAFSPEAESLREWRADHSNRGNRVKEALYWYGQGEQKNPERPVWAEGVYAPKTPDDSLTTFNGAMNSLFRTDNTIGAYGSLAEDVGTGPVMKTAYLPYQAAKNIYAGGGDLEETRNALTDAIRSVEDLGSQQKIGSWVRRKTPLYPDDPEARDQAKQVAEAYNQQQESSQNAINAFAPQAFQSLGFQPRYLSPAEDAFANIFRSVVGDPASLLSGGVSTLRKIPAGSGAALKAFNQSAKGFDWAEELPYTGASLFASDSPFKIPETLDDVWLPSAAPGGRENIRADDPRYKDAYDRMTERERARRLEMREGAKLFK